MLRAALATALLLLPLGPAVAGSYRLDIEMRANRFVWVIRDVTVPGGAVAGFRRNAATGDVSVRVTLPDGACVGRVRVHFTNTQVLEAGSYNFCAELGMWVD